MAKSRIVIIVIADGEVPIDTNPTLVNDIEDKMRDTSVGPGYEPGSIEYLEEGITQSMMEQSGWGKVPDPMDFRHEGHGVYMTFPLPYVNEDQINQTVAAVDAAVEPKADKYIIGCM